MAKKSRAVKDKKVWDKAPETEDKRHLAGCSAWFANNLTEAESKRSEERVYSGKKYAVLGVPLPALSQQILFRSTVYALGRMGLLIGESDVGKTFMLYELMRWHLAIDGGARYVLNEGRDTPEARDSILRKYINEFNFYRNEEPCANIEEWQTIITRQIQWFEEKFQKANGSHFCWITGLDSVTGSTNKSANDKIEESGFASLQFAQDANLINIYSKFLFHRVHRLPFSFLATSHIKYGQDKFGNRIMRIPGGDALRYNSTYILLLTKLGKDIMRPGGVGGRRLSVKSMKNFGDHSEIEVEYLFWREDGQQVTVWDWHGATIEHLINLSGEKAKAVADIIQFPTINKTVRTVSCPKLGFPKAEIYSKVGQALMANEKILRPLQELFGVQQRVAFRTGVPYRQQIDEAVAAGSVEQHLDQDIEGAEDMDGTEE